MRKLQVVSVQMALFVLLGQLYRDPKVEAWSWEGIGLAAVMSGLLASTFLTLLQREDPE